MIHSISLEGALGFGGIDRVHEACERVDAAVSPVDLALDLSGLEYAGPAGIAVLGAKLRAWKRAGRCDAAARYRPPSGGGLDHWLGQDALEALLVDRPHRAGGTRAAHGCEPFCDIDGVHSAVRGLSLALLQRIPLEAPAIASVGTMIEEICRNVMQHGDPAGGVAALAAIPGGRFELAVADVGIGVGASLRRNPEYADVDSSLALRKVLNAGVTGAPGPARGMGLYLTRLVLAENGGMLTLRSGDAHVMCTPSSVSSVGAPWIPGTLVVARIRTDSGLLTMGASMRRSRGPAACGPDASRRAQLCATAESRARHRAAACRSRWR